MTSESINLKAINWVQSLQTAQEPFSKTCYTIGGLLSKAVLTDSIQQEILHSCFDVKIIKNAKKRDRLAAGYLYWRLGQNFVKTYPKDKTVRDVNEQFQRIFHPLEDEILEFMIPLMNQQYYTQIIETTEVNLFRRFWNIIAESNYLIFFKIRGAVSESFKLDFNNLAKLFIVFNEEELDDLIFCDQIINNEEEAIREITNNIEQNELEKMWNIILRRWTGEELLKNGRLFLNEVKNRKNEDNSSLMKEIKAELHNDPIERCIDDLLNEYESGNPFSTWIKG